MMLMNTGNMSLRKNSVGNSGEKTGKDLSLKVYYIKHLVYITLRVEGKYFL